MTNDNLIISSQNIKKAILTSTQRMISKIPPVMGSGNICGRYLTYPKAKNDTEGGLRLNQKFKNDSNEWPLITYITVTYNSGNTLFNCMSSVWMQTYPNIEYIIIDGASTDNTLDLIKRNNDKIDYFISQKDQGIYNAMNKGIALASGRLICFMNSDDVCVPQAAEKIVEEFKKTDAEVICGERLLYQNGKEISEITYLRPYIKKCVFRYIQMHHQATYSSKQAFEAVGYFDESYKLLSDWIWESKCIDKGLKVHFFNEVLTKFNYDGASFIGIEKKDNEWIRWIMETFPKLSAGDAEYFLYALDRSRMSLCNFKGVLKKASHYFPDKELQKCLYESMLFVCIDMCQDIAYLQDKYTGFNFPNIMVKGNGNNYKHNSESVNDLKKKLEILLNESIGGIQTNRNRIIFLVRIKTALDKMFYDYKLIECFGKRKVLFFRRLWGLKLLTINKLFASNKYVTIFLFRKLRDSWKIQVGEGR